MSTLGAARRRILTAFGFIVAVPAAVVTCQGRAMPYDDDAAEGSASEQAQAVGGAPSSGVSEAAESDSSQSQPGAGGAYNSAQQQPTGGTYAITQRSVTSAPSTSTAPVTTLPSSGRTFLGKYVEPAQTPGVYYTPLPPATATVKRPCEEREEVCAGAQPRSDWARSVVERCMAETQSAGCIDFAFEKGASCSDHVVYWNGASLDLGRCVAAVDYYEKCSGPDEGQYVTVIRGGVCPSPI